MLSTQHGAHPRRRPARAATTALLAALVLTACTSTTGRTAGALSTRAAAGSAPTQSPSVEPAPAAPSDVDPTPQASADYSPAPLPAPVPTAAEQLASLQIKGRAPGTGYHRRAFGQRWADTDRNGCDTRNDMLRRDLTDVSLRPGSDGCTVVAGTLTDPYSGAAVALADVQIDHVVALADAWQKGAADWAPGRREELANDPLNLQATDGRLNLAKGAGDAATWLPPAHDFRCGYVARQVSVKVRYGLWVTQAEHDAIARLLEKCPGQPAAVSDSGRAPRDRTGTGAGPAPDPQPAAEPVEEPSSPSAAPAAASGCEPAYPDVCLPMAAGSADLDCSDVPASRFRVLAPDPYRFDGDADGIGCEG